jgi:hypothetical protein
MLASSAAALLALSVTGASPVDDDVARKAAGRTVTWATRAAASSQYGDPAWSARQATGTPNTGTCGDQNTAWATQKPDAGNEWIEVWFPSVQPVSAIVAVETYNAGALVRVDVDVSGRWTTMWTGTDSNHACPGVFLLELADLVSTDHVRLHLDTTRVKGWNEIDAVAVLGPRVPGGGSPLAGVAERTWAQSARASSQYGTSSWTAMDAAGPPNTPICGDRTTAWATKNQNGGHEWLELTFPASTTAYGAAVVETYNPGAVASVEARLGGAWTVVWQGTDTNRACPGEFVAPFSAPVVTQQLRVVLDTKRVHGWNEIDAVGLITQPIAGTAPPPVVTASPPVISAPSPDKPPPDKPPPAASLKLKTPAKAIVLPLRALRQVNTDVAAVLTSFILSTLQSVEDLDTVSAADVEAMLGVEKQKEVLGCNALACAADLGGALGADYTVYGDVAKIGSRYSINLSAIHSQTNSVAARVAKLVPQDEDALIAAVPEVVTALVEQLNKGK